jgi:hypothetical protein
MKRRHVSFAVRPQYCTSESSRDGKELTGNPGYQNRSNMCVSNPWLHRTNTPIPTLESNLPETAT